MRMQTLCPAGMPDVRRAPNVRTSFSLSDISRIGLKSPTVYSGDGLGSGF
jgi:hypothetical protein